MKSRVNLRARKHFLSPTAPFLLPLDSSVMKFRLEVDLLIIGCEASLWIGEQFASDLQNLFPALRVVAMSANKVIGKLPIATH